MTEFGLVKSFDIDDGQLDGIPPHQCFVLGYELAMIDEMLKRHEQVDMPVRAENQERIRKSCKDAGVDFQLQYQPHDVSESWMFLTTYGTDRT